MLKIGDIVNIKIDGIANGGEGVGRIDNFVVFVPFTAVGDEIQAEVLQVSKSFARAKINSINVFSKDRVTPLCKFFYDYEKVKFNNLFCGGCDFMHIDYLKQMEYKKNFILNSLSKIGKIENIEKYNLDIEICPLEKQFGYRNKLQFPLSKDKETRKIFYGLYMNGTHSVVDIDKCAICSIEANELLLDFIKYANFEDLKIYDELEVLNGFRHINIRINRKNEAILTIVGTYDYDENNSQIRRIKRLAEKLFLKYQEKQTYNLKINGIIYAVNSKKTNFVFGDKFHTLIGKDEVIETFKIDDKKEIIYKISSASFFQINTFIAEKLYQNIRSFIFERFGKNGLKPKILDLFCGSGGIGLFVSDLATKIIGIDVVEQSIENAEIAAADNNIDNAIYFVSKVEDEKNLKYILSEQPDIVIVNPPRKGIDEKVIKQIKKINPKIIIYVSCNPVSLARDLKIFGEDNGYFLDKIKAFDMFPQTSNVETLAILSKINIEN